jgi:nucleotide-binding universal stress UspA family protein
VSTILCPTRGGEASYPNQDRAIQLAKEQGSTLVFLHVTNVEFLDRMASPVLIDLESELIHLGEFVLVMAQERAEKAGVKADTVCKSGDFQEALFETIEEYDVDCVILGSPVGETAYTTQPYLENLIQAMINQTDVEVLVLLEGEILENYTSNDHVDSTTS